MDRSPAQGDSTPAGPRPLPDPLGRGPLPPRPSLVDRPLPSRGALPTRWPDGALAAATDAAAPRAGRPLTPNAFLVARHDLTDDLARFTIRPDGGVPAFHPGQYVSLGLGGDGAPVLRPYSIASAPLQRDELELLIRRLDGGAFTSRLWAAEPGTRLWVGPPRGLFTLRAGDAAAAEEAGTPLLFLSAGTGLAPVMAMLGSLATRPTRPSAILLHGATRVPELAYRDRLEGWSRQGWLTHRPTISRPDDPANAGWGGATGRVEAHVEQVLSEQGIDPSRLRVFACGNDGMVAASREALGRLGVPESSIHSESFTPAKAHAA